MQQPSNFLSNIRFTAFSCSLFAKNVGFLIQNESSILLETDCQPHLHQPKHNQSKDWIATVITSVLVCILTVFWTFPLFQKVTLLLLHKTENQCESQKFWNPILWARTGTHFSSNVSEVIGAILNFYCKKYFTCTKKHKTLRANKNKKGSIFMSLKNI